MGALLPRGILAGLCILAGCGTARPAEPGAPAGPSTSEVGALCGVDQRQLRAYGITPDKLRASDLVLRVVDHTSEQPITDLPLALSGGNEVLGQLECPLRTDRYGVARARVASSLYKLALVNRPDLVARTGAFYSGEQHPREIRIERAGAISGRVVDDRGQPMAKVVVTVGGEDGLHACETDASGAFRCDRLWSGEHTVTVSIDDRASVSRTVMRSPGQDLREVNFTLVPGGVLVVRATCGGPCVGATVAASIGEEVREEQVGADGTVRLRDLPAGEVRIYGFRDDPRGVRLRARPLGVMVQAGRTVTATLELARRRN